MLTLHEPTFHGVLPGIDDPLEVFGQERDQPRGERVAEHDGARERFIGMFMDDVGTAGPHRARRRARRGPGTDFMSQACPHQFEIRIGVSVVIGHCQHERQVSPRFGYPLLPELGAGDGLEVGEPRGERFHDLGIASVGTAIVPVGIRAVINLPCGFRGEKRLAQVENRQRRMLFQMDLELVEA